MKVSIGLAIIVATVALGAGASAARAAQCGPFGDPPATVDHGTFASFLTRHNPICSGGEVLGPWTDADGSARYSCRYAPAAASITNPLPLVIFLHGSIATADSVKMTGLPGLIATADLGGKTPGFILLAPQGRYTNHFYPGMDSAGFGWDNWYRQLSPQGAVTIGGVRYQENPDAAAIDHFIAEQVAAGNVDQRRIYVMGWSNGAAFALLYALNRPSVAAAAVYSAPNPFGAFDDPCPQTPVAVAASGQGQLQLFNPQVPMMHLRNDCDIGGICPNGIEFGSEVRAIGADLEDVILDPSGNPVTACDLTCGTDPTAAGKIGAGATVRGFWHHMRWPSAWNDKLLAFLRQHPLGAAAVPSPSPAR
ncbi:MAG TPA: PHB depolymerase family esterase [Candidatus Binataceae bacterium]|nr:PHB depolymerase family esterase [Candidatus Binataceae bacterium]